MPTLLKLYKARYFDTLIEPIYSDLSIDKILRYQKHTTVIVHLVAEAPTQRCSVKMVFLKISQNSQETTVPESLFR